MSLQGCYFCVKQYALECSRIPMGQTVNSQVNATAENHIPPTMISGHSSPLDERCDLTGGAFKSVKLQEPLAGIHMDLRFKGFACFVQSCLI